MLHRTWGKNSDENFKGPFLDLLGGQLPCAQVLLAFFREMIEDEAYVARFKRHYAAFREALRGLYVPASRDSQTHCARGGDGDESPSGRIPNASSAS